MRAFHQVTTVDESGNSNTTLDVNGAFIILVGLFTWWTMDVIMEGIVKIRAKKYEASSNSLNS